MNVDYQNKYNDLNGYFVRQLPYPAKRICLALDLKDDDELMTEYKRYHSPRHYWKEIGEGIVKCGIPVMDIYLVANRMFMICEVAVETDFNDAWDAIGQHEKQTEWSELMAMFQQALPGHDLEWVKMERVYQIPALAVTKETI